MFAKTIRPFVIVGFVAAVICVVGCAGGGPQTAVVRGKVTYKNKAVPNGTITFIPDSGPTATGEIKPDGSYTLTTYRSGDGAVLGKHTVVIVAMQDTSGLLPEARTPLPPPIIPLKYTSSATSDLRADVKLGTNTCDFELVDDKKK